MSQRLASPWPDSTPAPTAPAASIPSTSYVSPPPADAAPARSLKRRRAPTDLQQRDDSGIDWSAINDAKSECASAGNEVFSCYPTADTILTQNSYVTFVWNSKQPAFAQTNSVNIYLYRADSREQMYEFTDIQNPLYGTPGVITQQIDDTWWPSDWSGSNDTYAYYFMIKRSDQELDGSDTTQSVFSAVQTTYANSVLASMSSASSASSASSVSMTATPTTTGSQTTATGDDSSDDPSGSGVVTTTDSDGDPITYTTDSNGVPTDSNGNPVGTDSNGVPTTTGSVQDGDHGADGFPNWAIAVIVVLGFLALVFACLLTFFICRRMRRRRELDSQRNSMGSSTPMMANVQDSNSPLMSPASPGGAGLAGAAAAGAGVGAAAGAYSSGDRHSSLGHDASSTISAGDSGPFSGADAAIMADAFRKALRKPDFAAGPVEEGESPEQEEATTPTGASTGMLSRELAEEGRDIRSVSSSRGVRIEGSEDGASTVHHDY